MKEYKESFSFPWLLTMAWRDSRRSRSRLVLFISSVILGIAALVAIYSLGDNLRQNIDTQAAALLGADLQISGTQPAPAKLRPLLDSLSKERSKSGALLPWPISPRMAAVGWRKCAH